VPPVVQQRPQRAPHRRVGVPGEHHSPAGLGQVRGVDLGHRAEVLDRGPPVAGSQLQQLMAVDRLAPGDGGHHRRP
jgi:hypothetical protein